MIGKLANLMLSEGFTADKWKQTTHRSHSEHLVCQYTPQNDVLKAFEAPILRSPDFMGSRETSFFNEEISWPKINVVEINFWGKLTLGKEINAVSYTHLRAHET